MQLNRQTVTALLLALCLMAGIVWLPDIGATSSAFSAARLSEQTLIIDPGHGGEDGGAVALSGTFESHLNLEIALKLDQVCGIFGVHTLLLRTTDTSLAAQDATTLREKKRSDLLARVQRINETPNAVLLSIHQNHYPDPSSHGAQVFYCDDAESAAWGTYTQTLLVERLDPTNHRVSKPISHDIYLMNHIRCSGILVECGFLSNPTDDQRLESDLYQHQLAAALLASYITYLPEGEASHEGKNAVLLHSLWK